MALLEVGKWKYVGVDGCKGGWFCMGLDDNWDYGFEVAATFADLVDAVPNADLVLIDIPIGLPEGPGGREADFVARSLLDHPHRKSSVFPTPTRQTVRQASRRPSDYAAAVAVSRRSTGKGLSRQAFAIAPKIAEVDDVLAARSRNAAPVIREVHPELCFWALDFGEAMSYGKKSREGEEERLQVLRWYDEEVDGLLEWVSSNFPKRQVARDDIVDALAAAVTARLACVLPSGLRTAPTNPPMDSKGLRMEMVYWLPKDARRGRT